MSRYIDLDKLLEYEYMECLTISDCREVKKLGIEYCTKYCTIRDECFLFWANDNIEDVALERLTPLPPYKKEFATVVIHYCPRCGNDLKLHPNYCHNCGQAIEWIRSDYECLLLKRRN